MTDRPAPSSPAEFALQALIAAGYASQELVDRAMTLPGAPNPAHSAAPVAWLSPWRADQVTTDYDAYGRHGIPLYTAPQPVGREPLTDAQIKGLIEDGVFFGNCKEIVRAVEAAHGITGGHHGTE